jgi:hypothetical protein
MSMQVPPQQASPLEQQGTALLQLPPSAAQHWLPWQLWVELQVVPH